MLKPTNMSDMWGWWLNRGLDKRVWVISNQYLKWQCKWWQDASETERFVEDAVMMKYYSSSQSLPTIHTQKYVLFLHKEYMLLRHNISKQIGMQQLHLTSYFPIQRNTIASHNPFHLCNLCQSRVKQEIQWEINWFHWEIINVSQTECT